MTEQRSAREILARLAWDLRGVGVNHHKVYIDTALKELNEMIPCFGDNNETDSDDGLYSQGFNACRDSVKAVLS